MSVRCYVGDRRVDALAGDDRGFAYGDGLFETMRAHRGTVPWWDRHWTRLVRGAARLGMALPDESLVARQARAALCGDDSVLKLVVSRGQGGRGYTPPLESPPTWVLSRHPLPPPPRQGLALRWCATRLGLQPSLAGIKHCNRLEQVLARAEWQRLPDRGCDVDEGLMASSDGDVVCATASNLFVLHGSRWRTPLIDRCGVAGVCRQWVLETLEVEECRLNAAEVESADAVFLCNAVRGILPVAKLDARAWRHEPQIEHLQQRLGRAHPGFAPVPPSELP